MKNTSIVLAAVFLLGACASKIETVTINPQTLEITGRGVEGVVYYEPTLVRVDYIFRLRVDSAGKITGAADEGTCLPTAQKSDIVAVADYTKAKAILHKPSLFSQTEFSVNLHNGMLASVSTKSNPQAPLLLEQVVAAAGITTSAVGSSPPCNAGAVIEVSRFSISSLPAPGRPPTPPGAAVK